MRIKNNFIKFGFLCLFAVNLGLRLWGLDKSPISINWDEASLGYNAYSLAKTNRDEYGKFWPLSLRSFSDYKPALYTWLTVPLVKVFGLNQTTTRAVSAISGTVSILGIWLILGLWIKKPYLRLLLTAILSIEPWRLHFSRTALETNLSASFFVFGAYFLIKSGFGKAISNKKQIVISMVFFLLAAYSYHSARLAVPAFFFLLAVDPIKFIFKKQVNLKLILKNLSLIIFFAVFLLPVFFNSKSSEVLTRFRMENIFTRYWPYAPVELFNNSVMDWVRLNPLYYLLGLLVGHFSAYFSPVNYSTTIFHWIRKSVQYIPEFNLFGWMEIFFLISGLFILLKNIKRRTYRVIFYWIIAGAAPAAVTWNWFHSLRVLNALPAIEIIILWGMIFWWKSWIAKKRWRVIVVALLFVWQAFFIVNNELVYSVWENHGEYQPGGFKDGVPLIEKLAKDYDQIIIDSPHAQSYIFFLFYQSFDPKVIQSLADSRIMPDSRGSWNFEFDKYVFRKVEWKEDKYLKKTILFVDPPIEKSDIEAIPNAKAYYFKSPNSTYNSSMIVTLD